MGLGSRRRGQERGASARPGCWALLTSNFGSPNDAVIRQFTLLRATAAKDFKATLLMPINNYNKIVVTIHGIRTNGAWQKEITPALASHGLIPYHINYGFFFATWFLFKPFRENRIEAIRRELIDLRKDTGTNRISIIAHSFGTFIAMEALRRDNGELKYDRVVLTGSILPRNFDWRTLFERELATAVFNVTCHRRVGPFEAGKF